VIIPDNVQKLVEELRAELNAYVTESNAILDLITKIADAGFDTELLIEMSLRPNQEMRVRQAQGARKLLQAVNQEAVPVSHELTPDDEKFLRELNSSFQNYGEPFQQQ
jgi:hypothetical protein